MTPADLLKAAQQARSYALCSYSGFAVGAALETSTGQVYSGCNIENASYGLTVCAERVALWKALSEGVRRFTRIAIVTGANDLTPPCGACRQLLWEYTGDIEVNLGNLQEQSVVYRLSTLFPHPFGAPSLQS